MPLSDPACKNAKPKDKQYKLSDGDGMFLLVHPNGGKYWRMKYRLDGTEKNLALGVYPEVSLSEARERRAEARKRLASGNDPAQAKKEAKRQALLNRENTFEAIAREWHASRVPSWSDDHAHRVMRSLVADVFPTLGSRPIAEITAPELLAVLRVVEKRGAHEVAGRLLQRCNAVFRYAVATGRITINPASELSGALTTKTVQNFARVSADELPALLRAMDTYDGHMQTRLALRLLSLTFVRTAELRHARWEEFDFDKAEWRIPAERMKMRQAHIVPLSRQAIAALEELRPLNGEREWVFPNQAKPQKPMSENTVLFAIYRMGYHSRMTGHGFRGIASTMLNEMGYMPDVIERQLAHAERNKVRAAYNHAQYLPERREMMQYWADYLDGLRSGKVITANFKRAG